MQRISKLDRFVFVLIEKIENCFSIKKAQLFEYTFAHILDKNFESFFGFIHVLPGAWSAYRWEALSESRYNKNNILESSYLPVIVYF
jgi:chitin synthase